MATTLRILHQGTEPLDGETPLTSSMLELLRDDFELGMAVLVLPPGTRFGVLDPGLLRRLGGPGSTSILRSATVLSRGAPMHCEGSCLAVRPPTPMPGASPIGSHDRILADLGVHAEGVVPRMPSVPCPPGHAFVFDTRGDGDAPGPHLLQLTFETARLPRERSAEVMA